MATAHMFPADERLVPVEEYLGTSYRPDCDYVDGRAEERSLGGFEHSRVQFGLIRIFGNHEGAWCVITAPECRLRVG